jgi:ribosome production factor 2
MGVIQRVVKPRNQKSKRALEAREPKALENNKGCLFIRGTNCSETVMKAVRDLHSLKKPDSDFYSHKNDIRPFEDFTKIEFFSQKHDISLFGLGSNNKKRPDNLVLGRTYDYKMLDMVEFGIQVINYFHKLFSGFLTFWGLKIKTL